MALSDGSPVSKKSVSADKYYRRDLCEREEILHELQHHGRLPVQS